jgi:hypothetical protein
MKKYFFIFALLIFFGNSFFAYAATAQTGGFIPGEIWYSETQFKQGDSVKIHTAVWNGTDSALSAHVEFYDGETLLGSRDVTVDSQTLKDASITWKVTGGDHQISAKISSSSLTANGKKQEVTLSNNSTKENHIFVTPTIKASDGSDLSSGDIVKKEMTKATTAINNVLPSVTKPVTSGLASIDDFRNNTALVITKNKEDTQKQIDVLNAKNTKEKASKAVPNQKPLDATKKPIAYIKLFFLAVLSFVFGNKFIFYALCAVLLFLILRFLYRKIRRK